MQYTTLFALDKVGFKLVNFSFLLPGVLIFFVGLLLVLFFKPLTNPEGKRPMPRFFPFFMLGFGLLWLLLSAGSLYYNYTTAYKALSKGRTNIAEGAVTQFKTRPFSAHTAEQFCVRSINPFTSAPLICFHYSDYTITPGFNQTHEHGGPIHDGMLVRVTYIGNTIVKLEQGNFDLFNKPAEAPAALSK